MLPNRNGTAPGLALDHDGKLVLLLPGPPRELKPMFDEYVLPVLQKHFGAQARFDCRTFKVVGLAESVVEEQVAPTLADLKDIELGYSAKMGEVEVRIISHLKSTADEAEKRIRAALGNHIYGSGRRPPRRSRGQDAGRRAQDHRRRRVLHGRDDCQSNHERQRLQRRVHQWLRHLFERIESAVARCARRNIEGPRRGERGSRPRDGRRRSHEQRDGFWYQHDGHCGPDRRHARNEPVGLVYIGFATPERTDVRRHILTFDRETFKFFVSQYALDAVRRELLKP